MFFFFNDTATTEIYTLSLHDALPISAATAERGLLALVEDGAVRSDDAHAARDERSEEHTSELQSLAYLVCRLLLEKKNPRHHRRPRPDRYSPDVNEMRDRDPGARGGR